MTQPVMTRIMCGMLLVVVMGATACTSSARYVTLAVADLPCVADLVDAFATIYNHERLSLLDAINLAGECVPATITTYQVLSAPDPQADIEHELDSNGQIVDHAADPVTVTSKALANCDSAASLVGSLAFTVPFALSVGNQKKQGTGFVDGDTTIFDQQTVEALGKGTDQAANNAQIVARDLYQKDNIGQFLTPGDSPSGYLPIAIPPRTKEAFKLTLTIYYRTGGALISSNGDQGVAYAWMYLDGVKYPAAGDVVALPSPVTATDCP